MADGKKLTASYPMPPKYYKNYTDENIEMFNNAIKEGIPTEFDLNPPEPITGNFKVFGQIVKIY